MSYFGTAINESPVIAIQAGEEIAAPAFLAVTADGKLAKDGALALGIVTPDCDDKVAAGDDLTVQIKDIGLWLAGAEVAVGDELTPDENGKAKKAEDGNFIVAIALNAATKADQRVTVQICKAGYAKKKLSTVSLAKVSESFDLLGKHMSDFSDDLSFSVEESVIKATGTLKKVTGFKSFNQNNPAEQNGYYLPFAVTPPEPGDAVSIQVNEKPEVSSPEDNTFIVFLGEDEAGKSKTIKVKAGSADYTVDMSALVLGQ